MSMYYRSGAVIDTENMNPDDDVDVVVDSRRKHWTDIESLSCVDRHKSYNPNHYQDDTQVSLFTSRSQGS